MKTIQMTIDDDLVEGVDALVKELKTSRSAFTREALREALRRQGIKIMENKQRRGYERFPADPLEFKVWEQEQQWGDE